MAEMHKFQQMSSLLENTIRECRRRYTPGQLSRSCEACGKVA
uniref:Uncharacterized protein n=1 Tax=Amazona collaria TaxID=241587 RepID=A0A8B9FZJ1_9PSIT